MKVSRVLAYTLLACALVVPCGAQEEKPTGSGESTAEAQAMPPVPVHPVRRVVEVKNRDIIGDLRQLAHALGVVSVGSRELGVISLVGPEDAVAIAEDTIRRFDVPRSEPSPRNADFTAYLIVARLEGDAAPVPEALESVIAQLRSLLPFERYELVETVSLRVADMGLSEVNGTLPALSPALSGYTRYELALQHVRLPGDAPDRPPAGWVSLSPFFKVDMTLVDDSGENGVSSTIKTRIELREGQKVVVGKAAIDDVGTSVILVLTVKLDG